MIPGRRHLLGGAAACALAPGAALAARPWAAVTRRLAADYPADGPGAVAIAARGERIAYARGFGLAELELGVPMGADSVVRIASLTKQFTAVATLRLIEAGGLSLDDSLALRLADCPTAWRPITLRNLLSQTSGLTGDMAAIFAQPLVDRSPGELLAPFRDRPLTAPPGARWGYSNLNYWLLGKIIETTTGEPYADHIVRHVLAPGMTRTRYGDVGAVIPGRALGYEREGGGPWRNARAFSQTIGYAAGGFLSTPADMARWYAALGRGEIVGRRMLNLAGEAVRTLDGKPTGYGLGWYVSQIGGERVLHHGGSSIGFMAYDFWVPARRLFAGVFQNSSDERGEPRDAARAVLAALVAKAP
ncbi:serine hydrolase domain-containing protein [Phenylobacterium sp.]|uniref:serine hydrolase domain-containing protein n=1 Tax=Phenylobacterium sp. TaxID=1871053 RepID=UPI002B9BAA99|nr:serine hydrolase domain-containing protein [Phenylobacterium sp.]HLZ76316.1 serine hydrolase domain-containing protein [Phenylobacterium sp.]